jgi:hypothetical protein
MRFYYRFRSFAGSIWRLGDQAAIKSRDEIARVMDRGGSAASAGMEAEALNQHRVKAVAREYPMSYQRAE